MIGHELAVEQPVSPHPEPRDQPGERHLGRVGRAREHALAEEGGAERHPVQAADQHPVAPAFDRTGVAELVEPHIALLDLAVDPGLVALGAAPHDLPEGCVAGHLEPAGAQSLPERAREAEAVERQDRPPTRLDPEHLGGVAAVGHREHPDRIGAQQQFGIDQPHRRGIVPASRRNQPSAGDRLFPGRPPELCRRPLRTSGGNGMLRASPSARWMLLMTTRTHPR